MTDNDNSPIKCSDDEGDEEMDSEDEREEDKAEQEIDDLKNAILENPYMYDNHVSLINACKKAGEFDHLREAREKMQKIFPLTEDIWLSWLQDEIKFCDKKSQEDRQMIVDLFEKAVKDYLSVPIWLEYIHFMIGGLDSPNGLSQIREVCERALTHAGLHVTKGSDLWEAYRELENVILARCLPSDGVIETNDQDVQFDAQHKRVLTLFKRQLSVPLRDMKGTLKEYKEYEGTDPDHSTMQMYQRAVTKLSSIQQYEDKLSLDDPEDSSHMTTYVEYLDHELKLSDPARIQCLFERAITDNSLKPDLWIKYTTYLDKKLKIKVIVLLVYERSVRNCPWSSDLWVGYLRALERFTQPHSTVKDVFQQALTSCVSTASDSLHLWTTYCDYCRRRIRWSQEQNKDELDEFREAMDTAINDIFNAYGVDGDPTCSLQRYYAFIEASHCKNMEKARELWHQVMTSGHGNDANMWLEYFNIERAYGNQKHCRKVLQQALNSVREWPEVIVEAYLLFERCEGSLEQYDEAKMRCESQIEIVTHRRLMAAAKEAKSTDNKKTPKTKNVSNQKINNSVDSTTFTPPPSTKSSKKSLQQDTFKIPLPVLRGASSVKHEEPPAKKQCYKPALVQSADGQSENNRGTDPRDTDPRDTDRVRHDSDPDRNDRTVFVSNLPYSLGEEGLASTFSKCGELSQVRLVRNAKGTSKGFAYVEFTSKESCAAALRMDRQTVEGRPIYVSAFKTKQQPSHFKYSTELEKRKLFVSGLPFTCTKEALEQIFSQHGTVMSVRLVTYRNGTSKGLAYVEFSDETMASQAVLKTDGLRVGEHNISVALSNPPARKQPLKSRPDDVVPTLGRGKMETEQRGKARTQLSMMPRAVTRVKPATAASPTLSRSSKSDQSTSSQPITPPFTPTQQGDASAKMSNSDFRAMLLKK